MSEIRIHLTDGFENDHVVVCVDGRIVLDERDVTYSPLYGFTGKSASAEIAGEKCRIEVELPDRGLRAVREIKIRSGPHVVVAVEKGTIEIRSARNIGFG